MSCWYASANDRLQLNTERESTYFQGIIPQENRCFFCTQKAVFPINRQDGINSLPCFFRPITAKKNGDFYPETMSFQHLITQSGAFCFFGSIKRDLIFLEKGCRFIFLSGNKWKDKFFRSFFSQSTDFGCAFWPPLSKWVRGNFIFGFQNTR